MLFAPNFFQSNGATVVVGGEFTSPLVINDSYIALFSRELSWEVTPIPGMTTPTAELVFFDDRHSVTYTGTVNISNSPWVVSFDITEMGHSLCPGWYHWKLSILNSDGTVTVLTNLSTNYQVEFVA